MCGVDGTWICNKFFKLLNEVQGELKGAPLSSYRLIEPEAFSTVTAVDFYRITANLSILPGGLDKIRNLMLQPDADGKPVRRAQFLGGLFQKLSEKIGHKASANDKEMFEDIQRILGNGDLKKGQAIYTGFCNKKNYGQYVRNSKTSAWLNGQYYDCLVPWMENLLKAAANYPQDKLSQTKWMTNVIYTLEEVLPLPQLLKFLGEENYIFFVRINGFRSGDEDGDLEYFSNTLGDLKRTLITPVV